MDPSFLKFMGVLMSGFFTLMITITVADGCRQGRTEAACIRAHGEMRDGACVFRGER
jgi:hypothetical protein